MGYYVNPPKETKEEFLKKHGIVVWRDTPWEEIPVNCLGVMLMFNGKFTAAGIAYSPEELEAFRDPDDNRPKKLFIVEKKRLTEIGCMWPGYEEWR